MLASVGRLLVFLFKGAGVMLAIFGVLIFATFVWFSINPPFASPKTGVLHASSARDLRLAAGQTTMAIRLEARVNKNALRTSSGRPDPPTLVAALVPTVSGPLDGVEVRVVPGDGGQTLTDVRETAPGRLEWTMPCPDSLGDCNQWVILLVQAPASTDERSWQLKVDGDVRYPAQVPTPGWSSFDLALRPVGLETGFGPVPVGAANGTADLTVDAPVVLVPVHVERGGAPGPGGVAPSGAALPPGSDPPAAVLRFTMAAERLAGTTPAGLDALAPVRATLLAADGTVVARLGVRPGDGGRTMAVPLPPCAAATCPSDYRIAFEWMDRRPDASYRPTWRAEVIGLPADGRPPVTVSLLAGDTEIIEPAGVATAAPAGTGPIRASGVDLRIDGVGTAGDPGPPLHVQMLVTATVDPTEAVGMTATAIRPAAFEGEALEVPLDLRPGETGSMVVNLEDGCRSARCTTWALHATAPYVPPVAGANQSLPLEVTWTIEVRAWRLVSDRTPLDVKVVTQ